MSKTIRRLLFSTVAILIVVLAASTVAFAGSSTPAPAPPQEDHSNDVAMIGGTWYTTLGNAVAAATAGQTIEIKKSFTESIDFVGKTLTINLNGCTWTAANGYCFTATKGGTITINGNGNGATMWGKQGYYNATDKKYYGGIGAIDGVTVHLTGATHLYSNNGTGKYPDYGALFAVKDGYLSIGDGVWAQSHGWDQTSFYSDYGLYIDHSQLVLSGTGYFDNLFGGKALIYLTNNSAFSATAPTANQIGSCRRISNCPNAIYVNGSNQVTMTGKFCLYGAKNLLVLNGSSSPINISDSVIIKDSNSTAAITVTGDKNSINISGGNFTNCEPAMNISGNGNSVVISGTAKFSSNEYGIKFNGGTSTANTLTIKDNATFEDNWGDYGGAIYLTGNVNATIGGNAKFTGNLVTKQGGAIYADSNTNLYIGNNGNPTFSGNSASEYGGAVYVNGGTLKIDSGAVFSDNVGSKGGHHIYTNNVSTITIAEGYKTSTNGKVTSYGCPSFTFSKNLGGSMISAVGCTKLDTSIKSSDKTIRFTNTGGSNGLQAFVGDSKTTTVNLNNVHFKGFANCASVMSLPGKTTINLAGGIFENCDCTDAPIVISSGSTLNQSDIAVTGSKTGETVVTKFESCKGGNAGAINNSGTLNIKGKPVFKNCSSANGAGVVYTNGNINIGGGEIKNCSGAKSVFYADKASQIDISNMTISGCKAACDGPVIYAPNATVNLSSVAIKDCTTSSNSAKGGAIYAKNLNLYLTSSISKASAAYGGAVYVTNSLSMSGEANLINCTASQDGGAVYAANGASMSGTSSIANCSAGANGGAIYVAKGSLKMSGNAYLNNCKASNNGGGIYLASGEADITGSKSSSKSATYIAHCSAGENGGCIYAKAGSVTIGGQAYTNGNKNQVATYLAKKGGSVYLVSSSRLTLEGNADLRYTAAQQGGGVYLEPNATLEITGNAKVSLCVAQTPNGVNDGEGGGVYNLGKVKITSGSDGGLYGSAAKSGGNIYNAGTFEITSGSVTNGSASLTGSTNGGNFYAASGSTATIDGEYAKFGSGMPNDFCAQSSSKITIKNGKFTGKLAGVPDAYDISGGWFIKSSYLTDYVREPYNISPKIVNAPDSTVPIKVYHNDQKATVTFYNNCPEGGDSVIETPKGYEIAIPTCAISRESWETFSWNTDELGNGTKYYPNSEGASYHPGEAAYHLIPSSDMKLYADWQTKEHAVRTLTFIDPTYANQTQTVTYTDRKAVCNFPHFYRSMYTLLGATLDQNGGGTMICNGDEIDWGYKHLEATVYLQWESDIASKNTSADTKQITYKDNQEGNANYVYRTSKSSATIIDAGFESKKYSFDCWCTTADGSGKKYAIGDTFTFTDAKVTLYAVWKSKADISDTATRYGEYTETGAGGKSVDIDDEDKTQEEKHPEYIKPGYYSLTYDDGYGDNNQFKQTFGETSARVIGSIWSRNNYKFVGWTTTAGSEKVEYVSGDSIDVTASPTLYAVWKKTGNSQPDKREEIIEQNDDPTYDPVEEYKELDDQKNNTGDKTGGNTDSNIPKDEYYSDAAEWAYEEGIATGGTDGSFNANAACTRAEMVTFLWRSMGEPEPTLSSNPFSDIKESDYYYKAVLWGYEEGIVKGTGGNKFSPNYTTTRSQGLTFLYRTVGEPSVDLSLISKFKDVKLGQFYTDAVAWAIEEGVTTGTTATTFSPDNTCSRGEIITFMYRALGTSN